MKKERTAMAFIVIALCLAGMVAILFAEMRRSSLEYQADFMEMQLAHQLEELDWHYHGEAVIVTTLRPSLWSKAETWLVQAVFADEPDVVYLFKQEADGGFVLAGTEGEGEPRKAFEQMGEEDVP